VRSPRAAVGADGLPTDDEKVRLDTVENRIRETAKGRDGVYVGRRQGLGNRDLLFYFPGRPSGLDDRIRASVGTEILFISKNDAAWKGYEQLLPSARDWRTIEDGRVIAELLNKGSDPTREHQVMHRVETSVQKGADALKTYLEKLELEDIQVIGDKARFIVTGLQRVPLNVLKISDVSYKLDQVAPKARGRYLGWLADPVGDGVADGNADFDMDFDDIDDLDEDFGADGGGDKLAALADMREELAALTKTFAKKDGAKAPTEKNPAAAEKPAAPAKAAKPAKAPETPAAPVAERPASGKAVTRQKTTRRKATDDD
jgi:regulator of RNase E activity RraB